MIHLKLRMEKAIKSPDENDDEEIRWFNSKMEILESMNEFDDIYSKQTSKIWNEISDFTSNGSGWVIKNVDGITVDISSYTPFTVGCEDSIPVPTQILNSKATVDIKDTKNQCFLYSTLCSTLYSELCCGLDGRLYIRIGCGSIVPQCPIYCWLDCIM